MSDANELAPKLRQADLKEIHALSSLPSDVILWQGLRISDEAYTICTETGEVMGIFGVCSHSAQEGCGIVWLLGSDELPKRSLTFLRHCREWVDGLLKSGRWYALTNIVHDQNTVSIRWLKWCGFTFGKEFKVGINGETFIEFYKYSNV